MNSRDALDKILVNNMPREIDLKIFLNFDIKQFTQLKLVCHLLNKLITTLESHYYREKVYGDLFPNLISDQLKVDQQIYFHNFENKQTNIYKNTLINRYTLKNRLLNKLNDKVLYRPEHYDFSDFLSSFAYARFFTINYTHIMMGKKFSLDQVCDALLSDNACDFVKQISILEPLLSFFIHPEWKTKKELDDAPYLNVIRDFPVQESNLFFIGFFIEFVIEARAINCFKIIFELYFLVLKGLQKTDFENYARFQNLLYLILEKKDSFFTNEILYILVRNKQFDKLISIINQIGKSAPYFEECFELMDGCKKKEMIHLLEDERRLDILQLIPAEKNSVMALKELKKTLGEVIKNIHPNISIMGLHHLFDQVKQKFEIAIQKKEEVSVEAKSNSASRLGALGLK